MMRRYTPARLAAAALLLGLPAFTCGVAPAFRQLVERVRALEGEVDAMPFVLDAEDRVVGEWAGLDNLPVVLIRVEGLPPLGIRVATDRLLGTSASRLIFLSPDCTGTAHLHLNPQRPFLEAVVEPAGGTVHVADQMGQVLENATFESTLEDGSCVNGPGVASRLYPALAATDLSGRFTPPFRVEGGRDLP